MAAAIYYIDRTSAGSDAGTLANPWKSYRSALNGLPAGGNAIVIDLAGGTYAESGDNGGLYIYGNFALPVHFFTAAGVSPTVITNAGTNWFMQQADTIANLHFHNITFTQQVANGNGCLLFFYSPSGASSYDVNGLVFHNCTFNIPAGGGTFAVAGWYSTPHPNFRLSLCDCTVNSLDTSHVPLAFGRTSTYASVATQLIDLERVTVNGVYGAAYFSGVTGRIRGGSYNSSTYQAVQFGTNGATGLATAGSFDGASITAGSSGHGLLIGAGAAGVVARNFVVSGSDDALVVKAASQSIVEDFTLDGFSDKGLLLKGDIQSFVRRGTIVSRTAGLPCFANDDGDAAYITSGCDVEDLRLVNAAASGGLLVNWTAARDGGGSHVDKITYDNRSVGGTIGTINGTSSIGSIAAAKTAWGATSANDANSTWIANGAATTYWQSTSSTDIGLAANWSNGLPNAAVTGIIDDAHGATVWASTGALQVRAPIQWNSAHAATITLSDGGVVASSVTTSLVAAEAAGTSRAGGIGRSGTMHTIGGMRR